jgi:ParB/RepB/Spo0J family partition protein
MPPYDDPEHDPVAVHRRDGYVAAVDEIVQLPLEKIHRHPHNRHPREEDIQELAASLDKDGQKEPIIVRPRPAPFPEDEVLGHYELISGETRVLAARRIGWDTIAARIRTDLDDAAALRELAIANAFRRDLDPIQRARMLRQLTSPVEEGGAGLPAAEAGQIYGLESDSGVRNAIQLLKLPEVWQQRVVSRELPESSARQLVPYVDCEPVLKELDIDFKSEGHWMRERFKSRDGLKWLLEENVRKVTRPVEKGVKHDYGYQLGGEHARYFKLDPDVEQKLQIVELPLGKNGKLVKRALNHKLYDELQKPLIQSRLAERKAGGRAKSAKPQTAAANAADEKRKRGEQADQVTKRVFEWRQRFLRLAIAETIQPGNYKTALLLPLLCHAAGQNTTNYQRAPLDDFLAAAVSHNTCDVARRRKPPQFDRFMNDAALLAVLGPHLDASDDPVDEIEHVHYGMVRYLLWPQCAGVGAEDPDEDVLSAGPPDMLPPIGHHTVEAIAAYVGADLRAHWQRGAIHGSYERPLIEEFFGLHYRWQLDELSRELLGSPLESKHGKTAAIQVLLAHHSGKHVLKLPKSIENGAAKSSRGKK